MPHSSRRLLSLVAVCLFAPGTGSTRAQVKSPPLPEKYDIDIRYRIDALRNGRARIFLDMVKYLKSLGFVRDPDDEIRGEDLNEVVNFKATRMKGTLPSATARKVLLHRSVLTILLTPAGGKLPAQDQPVRVALELASALSPSRQRSLINDLSTILRSLGFREAVGYDPHQFTRLVGTLPAGRLETLLSDVRRAPESWFLLSRTLLSDLKEYRGGDEILKATVLEWDEHPEGKAIISDVVADWGLQKPAIDYLSRLPFQAREDPRITRDLLRDHLTQNPEASPFLRQLFEKVLKSKSAPVLMDMLLSRLETRPASAVLPSMFRGARVFKVIEARPDLPLPAPAPVPTPIPDGLQKFTPEVRKLLGGAAAGLHRLEVVLSETPALGDNDWRRELTRAAPRLTIEGRVGPVVAVQVAVADLKPLAARQIVSTIRLPRPAESAVLSLPGDKTDPAVVLKNSGLERLHRAGRRGQKVRVAVLAEDFRGWDALVGKRLPASTQMMDLTIERNDTLQPDPFPPGAGPGVGTQLALAVRQAAPEAELTLVRVDPAAPYLLDVLLRRVNGETFVSASLDQRGEGIARLRTQLAVRRQALVKERRAVLNLFNDNKPPPKEDIILKERRDRLEAYLKQQKAFDQDEKDFNDLVTRYLKYRDDLQALGKVQVVVSGLLWVDGHPVDGGGPLTRYIDDEPLRALWVQPVGNNRGQAWVGLFHDADDNGVMEFAALNEPVPAGNWNHEPNFLAWRPLGQEKARLLPAGTRVRVSLQWREAHDPELSRRGRDPYREPLADLHLVLLQQFDPDGIKRPSDDMAVVAQTVGLPQRLDNRPDSSLYEQVLEFTIPAEGRYAVQVKGVLPESTAPRGTASLRESRAFTEVRPRLFVETLGSKGRVILDSYATAQGTRGAPADSLRALTVGAIDGSGGARPYTSDGPPAGIGLASGPDVWTVDRLGLAGAEDAAGTGMSAALAGGKAACLLSGGACPEEVRRALRSAPSRMERVPEQK
jgi:hypothetical protein